VILSSDEPEYVSLAGMICEVKYLRELSRGLGFEGCRVVNRLVETDNQSNSESGRGNNMH
jgi:hypothetical protein